MLERFRSVQKQLEETRAECLRLQQQLSAVETGIRPTESDGVVVNRLTSNVESDHRTLDKDSVIIASHMKQLNSIIGSLRAEKLDLTTQLRKQQLRIAHLENLVDQLSKQVDVSSLCVSVHGIYVLSL